MLAACGGESMNDSDASRLDQLAATVYSSEGGTPAPDCAPEGCSKLRIIDGNAEQFRAAAQTRAAEPSEGAAPAEAAAVPAQQVQVLQ